MDLAQATTEKIDPTYADLDLMSTAAMVTVMNEAEAEVPRAVGAATESIVAAVDGIAERMSRGGRLIYVGAGTPGRLGVLDASECPPTFSSQPGQVLGIIAGGQPALTSAIEGAEDDADQGALDLRAASVCEADTVVGITASGRTPYVLGAIAAAKEAGALTVGVSSNAGAVLSDAVDHPIEVVVGPEVIAGSTRLKAGSAQKQVLNMLSTLSMVKLGKTYGNLMVDVSASNEKLRRRALRLVTEVTGAGDDVAQDALDRSGNSVKAAILTIIAGVSPAEADQLLAQSNGFLREAIAIAQA